MAGDWIPRQKGLSRKPEVLLIASMTGLDRHQVADVLMEFWEWADDVTGDGFLSGFSVRILSASCPLDVHADAETFWNALVRVGWLDISSEGITIPNYDRWLGRSAKKRAKDVLRKRSVRKMSASEADKKRTTEDRRQKTEDREYPPSPPRGECASAPRSACASAQPEQSGSGFARFWEAYPKKEARLRAAGQWEKIAPDAALTERILAAIEVQKATRHWREGFVPKAAAWLRGRRWEDVVQAEPERNGHTKETPAEILRRVKASRGPS